MDARQTILDSFYMSHGACCAGCDWWRHMSGLVGECTRTAPVSGADRAAMLGMEGSSLPIGSGHILTRREHRCGEFQDAFNWQSLPPAYLRQIGYRPRAVQP